MTVRKPESSAAQRRRTALLEVLHQLAGRAHAACLFVPFERLRKLSERLLARRELELCELRELSREPLRAEARERLEAAHAREQARLLREALELVYWSTLEGRSWIGPCLSVPCLEAWSEEACIELDRALLDGTRVEGELLACCLLELEAWPSARELAGAAARLEPGWRAECVELHAALSDEPRASELAALEPLLKRELPLAERGRLHEAAAVAHERRAEFGLALEHYQRALCSRPGARAALAAWVLAGECAELEVQELAWRALLETWRGKLPLGAAREGRLWSELLERRACLGPLLSEPTRRTCEALLSEDQRLRELEACE